MTSGPVKRITEITIYESPDGGKTVYSRTSGESARALHGVSTEVEAETKKKLLLQKWINILNDSESNPALRESVERCIMLYDLTRVEKESVEHHPV